MDKDNRTLSRMDEDDKEAVRKEDDIHDSRRDEERLQPDRATLDLPDVSDIPGQEHVHVLPPGELADTTASSDDEEGDDVLGE